MTIHSDLHYFKSYKFNCEQTLPPTVSKQYCNNYNNERIRRRAVSCVSDVFMHGFIVFFIAISIDASVLLSVKWLINVLSRLGYRCCYFAFA